MNWFQLQQAQVVSLPVNNQSLCENAKLYEPGQRYIDFVQNLPADGPRLEPHSFDSAVTQNTGCDFGTHLLFYLLFLSMLRGNFDAPRTLSMIKGGLLEEARLFWKTWMG